MRNPGSDIDLAALYNNDSSKSMGFSLPNVPWPSSMGPASTSGLSLPLNNFSAAPPPPSVHMGQPNLISPVRSAPVPPLSNNSSLPQIMVTQDQDFTLFEGKNMIVEIGKKTVLFCQGTTKFTSA